MSDREALKIHEAHEHAELAHSDKSLGPVSLTMAVLAVLAAAISMLGHRAHTEVVLAQTKANFQKAELVGIATQQHADSVLIELMGTLAPANADRAEALKKQFNREVDQYANKLEKVKSEELRLEIESERARIKANRLDLGELFCEMALVLCSITLLTRQRTYWFAGIVAGSVGLILTLAGFWIR